MGPSRPEVQALQVADSSLSDLSGCHDHHPAHHPAAIAHTAVVELS